jgi:chaperonin GroES
MVIASQGEQSVQMSKGGVLLSGNAKGASDQALLGEVLEIGGKVTLNVTKGDTIVFQKYGTTDIDVPNGKVTFVQSDSVLGICN